MKTSTVEKIEVELSLPITIRIKNNSNKAKSATVFNSCDAIQSVNFNNDSGIEVSSANENITYQQVLYMIISGKYNVYRTVVETKSNLSVSCISKSLEDKSSVPIDLKKREGDFFSDYRYTLNGLQALCFNKIKPKETITVKLYTLWDMHQPFVAPIKEKVKMEIVNKSSKSQVACLFNSANRCHAINFGNDKNISIRSLSRYISYSSLLAYNKGNPFRITKVSCNISNIIYEFTNMEGHQGSVEILLKNGVHEGDIKIDLLCGLYLKMKPKKKFLIELTGYFI